MESIIERVETETGHFYRNKDTRQQIPGVTTILKALPKGALERWSLKKAVELALKGEKGIAGKPDHISDVDWLIAAGEREAFKAADVGTNAHNFAEAYMLGQNPSYEDLGVKEQGHADCFLNFVRDYQPDPVIVEKVVTHLDKNGQPLYCGTIDLVAKLTWNRDSEHARSMPNDWQDGLTWLVDYKASSKSARSSHALQASAYRYATHYLDEETGELIEMPSVDRTAVVLLNGGKANRCFRMYELDSSPVVFSVFKSLLRISHFSKIEDRVILGEM